ncbi:MAG: hypothetical protein HY717_13360 [Planctomycetes bacterium]|nr:hypothetical protein [Planctomycetota bacterium]
MAPCFFLSIALAWFPAFSGGETQDPAEKIIAFQDPAAWTAEPGWLGNPAGRFAARRGGSGVAFRVEDPGRGMKWRQGLQEALPLGGFRFVSIRCRAAGAAPRGDYLLALLGGPEGAPEGYQTPIAAAEVRGDGRWRTAAARLEAGGGQWLLRGLAVQVQADADPAEIEVAEVRFSRDAPLAPLADFLALEPLDPAAPVAAGFELVDLKALAGADASAHRESFRLRDPFPEGRAACSGVPFQLLSGPKSAVSTGLELPAGQEEARAVIPLSGQAAALALLLAARFEGSEEPALGSGELSEVRDLDRVAFQIDYQEGPPDRMLCLSIPEGRFTVMRGPQLASLFADPARPLKALTIIDRSPQAELFVLAATAVRSAAAGPLERQRPRPRQAHPAPQLEPPRAVPAASLQGTRAAIEAGALRAVIDLKGLRLDIIANAWIRKEGSGLGAGSRLLRVFQRGRELPPEAWEVLEARLEEPARVLFKNALREGSLKLLLSGEIEAAGDEIGWSLNLENQGEPADLELSTPDLEGLRLESASTDILCYPKRGAALTARPASFSAPGSGLFPLQFMDLSAPGGGGLYLRTEDRGGSDRLYEAAKGSGGARLAVRYPQLRLEAGQTLRISPTALGAHGGDWHEAFRAYRRWLESWHRPRLPLKPWFREVFNFRQRFFWFWDPVYDPEAGRLKVPEALAEAREAFGGLEYLHFMDWGSHPRRGRVYGRTGDDAPWEAWKGGESMFARGLEELRAAGVPAGLYVEGYLLEERGRLGSGEGKAWQIRGPGGEPRYWPGASEMFICPWVGRWKEIQTDTYRRLVKLFPARGVYIDQFGFADWGKKCWAAGHGHPVPAAPLLGERELTRAVSEALAEIDPQIAVYTEETPCDLANGFQDGSFTYAMNEAQRTVTDVPLNLARFAFPEFKTFEILICDQPLGSWGAGVLWTFFNGEGLWLEGPAREWFRPRTLAAIQKTHALLRSHREAFTALQPEPLVPTLAEGIHANRFPGEKEIVYTLWNALPLTYRGPVLALPPGEGKRFHDAWNGGQPLEPSRRADGRLEIALEIDPYGAGCVVAEK